MNMGQESTPITRPEKRGMKFGIHFETSTVQHFMMDVITFPCWD